MHGLRRYETGIPPTVGIEPHDIPDRFAVEGVKTSGHVDAPILVGNHTGERTTERTIESATDRKCRIERAAGSEAHQIVYRRSVIVIEFSKGIKSSCWSRGR